MKKSIAVVAMAFGVTSAFAQDLTSKKGEPFLPEAGEYAISVDANPFLNYVGNFFGKTNNNTAPTFNFLNNNFVITGKKFKDATNAYRASVRLGFDNTSTKTQTADRAATTAATFPDLPSMVENKHSRSNTNIGISVGIEKRRGKTRLQGVYGAEAGIFMGSNKDKYTYGNELNPTGTPAVVVSAAGDGMNGNANITTDTYGNAARVTVRKSGTSLSIGVRGFVGAEYFVAPKISIGGEFGWGIGFGMSGKSKTTTESIGGATPAVGEQTVEGAKSSTFMLDTDNMNTFFGPSGTLRLNLHF
ncbi:MAG: hypothetical protein C0448_06100 [Sphingobacteriaceae bacterium]|nr:hypothetical protein [Sphingobacteriaceae bacterium]